MHANISLLHQHHWPRPAGSRPLPVWSLILALIACLILPGSPLAGQLHFERSAIAAGELWRLFTCHWTHFSIEQLFWDVLAFLGFGIICERQSRAAFFLCLLGGGLLVPLAIWYSQPHITVYRGISGIDVGLFLCAATIYLGDSLARKDWLPGLLASGAIVIFLGKTGYEFINQSTLFVQPDAGFTPIPLAHLVGGLCGCQAALMARWIAWRNRASNTGSPS